MKSYVSFKTENLVHYGAQILNAKRSFEISGITQWQRYVISQNVNELCSEERPSIFLYQLSSWAQTLTKTPRYCPRCCVTLCVLQPLKS